MRVTGVLLAVVIAAGLAVALAEPLGYRMEEHGLLQTHFDKTWPLPDIKTINWARNARN